MNHTLPPILAVSKNTSNINATRDQDLSQTGQILLEASILPHKKPAYNMNKSRMNLSHNGLITGSNISKQTKRSITALESSQIRESQTKFLPSET